MSNLLRIKVGLISLLLFSCTQENSSLRTQQADAVYINAMIYTMEQVNPTAEAVAIKDGRYIYVGDSSGSKVYIGDNTQVFDLGGKMLMPGINDAHIHPTLGGIKELYECNFAFTATPVQIANQLRQCISENPDTSWIVGGQWDSGFFGRFKLQSPRLFLDQVSIDKAIILSDDSTHNVWVNSKALELAGIDKSFTDPIGGEFVRDQISGEPNGIVLESAAKLIYQSVPDWSPQQYQNAIKTVVKIGHQFGITGMKDAGSPIPGMAAYYKLDQNGELNLHIATSIRAPDGHREELLDYDRIDQLRDEYKSTNVHTGFVKIFMDGVPTASHTAAMIAPYLTKQGEKPTNGSTHISEQLLAKDLVELDRRGYTVKIHTAGDRAVREVLNAIQTTRELNGQSGLRHELAHAGYVAENDIRRFAELGAVVDLSPYLWHPSPIVDSIIAAVGQARGEKYWPINSYLKANAQVAAGSDWPAAVASMDPWIGIEAMITRRDPRTDQPESLWLEQAISLEQALRIFTIDGAKALRIDDRTGSVKVGKLADFIVLDQNIFNLAPEKISETQIEITVFSGDIVYRRAIE